MVVHTPTEGIVHLTQTTSDKQDQQASPNATSAVALRVLATTDVHGHILPFDYFTNTPDRPYGLARLATLIARARAEVDDGACVLFDNGDFLQGTPISDLTPQPGQGWQGPHPVLLAMNQLGYDAASLGNHEFNFGLDWLQKTLPEAGFPVVCANAVLHRGPRPDADETLYRPWHMLSRDLRDTDGEIRTVRIGVLGLVPPQIMTWDHAHLAGRLTCRDMVEAARAWVPVIRAAGADLVIALAHTGIGEGPDRPMMENAAQALARVPGIDALIGGHSHRIYPDPSKAPDEPGHHDRLNGMPFIKPGFRGSHLGVLDLTLAQGADGKWTVTSHQGEVRAAAGIPPEPAFCRVLESAHAHTLTLTEREIGRTSAPLHSYLALVRSDPATQLVNAAQRTGLTKALLGTDYEGLPVLSATAPFKTGGRGGPAYYTDMPAGALRLRNITDLYPFPNTLCGVLVSGADLRDWLERAAICFRQITPGTTDQMLLDTTVPGHDFDVIDGLSYAIDLSQPARYDLAGTLVAPKAHRIRDLCHEGKPVSGSAQFVVATNSYRAYGGGPFRNLAETGLIHTFLRPVRDVLADFIATKTRIMPEARPVWRFADMPDTRVLFDTGPGLRAHPGELATLRAEDLGDTKHGFARLGLWLGPQQSQQRDHAVSCESPI
ncbi:2',3'-cyclic-nucleotide 2'-phosphodiesterase / 3'-nucleotidase [Roseovarius marisflavi]|uniref:2',3'-cyclic-nucleotide 2'-phosphodiesterase / 3'-nucleotidase n=1 Tax=Roseovarius marisflavi TaxID=1054996 RepID=A0A1M7A5U1_9RHOB|nr:bifunctional 2',3'-cyclic-nucleotide 2'-phosphodiesterase/3'-nucleotidase [Roseovarius marisflavi]SHL38038.1 2',3'-cyclic-nucleotide 2'-phosphodiesterase / 3'-nucleotidase [Roseovarius marisflavi]